MYIQKSITGNIMNDSDICVCRLSSEVIIFFPENIVINILILIFFYFFIRGKQI